MSQIVAIDQPKIILLLDMSAISRASLSHLLLSKLNVVIKYDEVPLDHTPDLVIYNIHGASIEDPDVISKITHLRQTHGTALHLVVVADRDQEIAAIWRGDLYGYIPTGLHPRLFAAAISLALQRVYASILPVMTIPLAKSVSLTEREYDVLRLVRAGHPNKVIAYRLQISENTVKHHVHSVMRKLGAINRTQLAMLPSLMHRAESRSVAG